jgi:hypothetical protein
MSMEEKRRSWGEKRRERNEYWSFLHIGKKKKKKKKGTLSVVKLGILDFLLGRFTDGFADGKLNINIFNHSMSDSVCNI